MGYVVSEAYLHGSVKNRSNIIYYIFYMSYIIFLGRHQRQWVLLSVLASGHPSIRLSVHLSFHLSGHPSIRPEWHYRMTLLFKNVSYLSEIWWDVAHDYEAYCHWKWSCWANFCMFHWTLIFLVGDRLWAGLRNNITALTFWRFQLLVWNLMG